MDGATPLEYSIIRQHQIMNQTTLNSSINSAHLHSVSANARADILRNIQQGLSQQPLIFSPLADEVPRSPVPIAKDKLVRHFISRAIDLSASVALVEDSPAAITELMRYKQAVIPNKKYWVVSPELRTLLSTSIDDINFSYRLAEKSDEVGITSAFCAIADTGTLMTVSGQNSPSTISLLPETHIVIMPASRIVRYMEDAWALWQNEQPLSNMPRAVNFISGPSRTGDIEQTIVLGAHGPCRVHIILIQHTSH